MLAGGKVNKIIQPSRDEIGHPALCGRKDAQTAFEHQRFVRARRASRIFRRERAGNSAELLHAAAQAPDGRARSCALKQEGFERILSFTFDCTGEFTRAERILYAEIMGKYSNLVLTENGVITGALKISSLQENFKRALFPGVKYMLPEPQDKANPAERKRASRAAFRLCGRRRRGVICSAMFPACAHAHVQADRRRNHGGTLRTVRGTETLAEIRHNASAILYFRTRRCPSVERAGGEAKDFYARADPRGETVSEQRCAPRPTPITPERETERQDFCGQSGGSWKALLARSQEKGREKTGPPDRSGSGECAAMEQNRVYGELITANIYAAAKGHGALLEAGQIITAKMRERSRIPARQRPYARAERAEIF